MSKKINFTIDGKKCTADEGTYIIDAAEQNGVFIPTLCNYKGTKPVGSCRVCTVNVNKRPLTSCTTPIGEGMEIENETAKLIDFRKAVIELLFTEGNHFCPACEKSGNCELQALAYRYQIMAPRFPYQFNDRLIDASHDKIIHDHNRCIMCKRCIRLVKDEDGKALFTFQNRGHNLKVVIDQYLGSEMTEELADYAMEICPVGSILAKKTGFSVPIGERKFDSEMIGSEINDKTEVQ